MPASSGTCGPNLGTDAGPELPEAAMWALESWKDGARSCSLEPLAVERTVYCFDCGYRSEEHTSELQSLTNLVCRLLLEKKKQKKRKDVPTDEHNSPAAPRTH